MSAGRPHQFHVNVDKHKKRPENGSGRKVVGQIRGGSTDVNAALALPVAPNSATIWLIWKPPLLTILHRSHPYALVVSPCVARQPWSGLRPFGSLPVAC